MLDKHTKTKKSEMGTIGKLTPSESYVYKGQEIPAKCRIEHVKSFYEEKEFLPPRIVMVEPVSACNLTCIMCPTYLTDKPKSFLDFDLFKKIIDECKSFNTFFVFQGTGEPFLHPQLFDMIKYAKDSGIKNISVSTNATLLTAENIEKILNIETSPDFLQFSIDGHTEELYEKYRRGASFKKVHAGIQKLNQRREELGFNDKIEFSINTLLSNEFNLTEFLSLWGSFIDDLTVGVMLNQAAQKSAEKVFVNARQNVNRDKYISCPKPFESLSIMADGKITHCQHDFHHLHIKGDMNKGDTLLQTWRNQQYMDFREKHITFKAEETSCNGCEQMYRIENEDNLFAARKEIKEFFDNKKVLQ